MFSSDWTVYSYVQVCVSVGGTQLKKEEREAAKHPLPQPPAQLLAVTMKFKSHSPL